MHILVGQYNQSVGVVGCVNGDCVWWCQSFSTSTQLVDHTCNDSMVCVCMCVCVCVCVCTIINNVGEAWTYIGLVCSSFHIGSISCVLGL